ncbi:hypothetical protein C2857_006044 [Epichloe festucae Fl1]|uniref:Uncharacterized protein n=1 Tax=Epichloe festucae (strain Fl1) TaxID=877507 RepID=A0A7S9PW80_EPIFF|nr:hypothetical protein C2857_006044 [Epichloe festucae Fl1]
MLGLQIAPAEARTGGRSRYSKALPSVPVTSGNNLPPRPVPQDTSKLQLPPLPHPPPLSAQPQENDDGKSVKSVIVRKPVGSSAPISITPQPDVTSTHSPHPTPSPSTGSMAIPRRPVGGSLKLPSQPASIVPPEPSPTDSICSLLSAYTREPDAPMSGSTDTTANTSNNLPDSVCGNGNQSSQNQPAAARSGSDLLGPKHESRPPPPPPPKGESDKLYCSRPKPLPLAPSHEQTASPSPRPEIWKRRPQTAEKSKELPELKLNYSHGSTASISSIQTTVIRVSSHTDADTDTNTATESNKGVEESRRASPPRPLVKALPGRNIRPAAKDKPQNATHSMGSAASRVIHPGGKSATSGKASELKKFPVRVDSKRPPTPEYRTGDIDPPPPLSDNVTKPASPVSASGSPKEGMAETDTPKKQSPQPFLPLKSDSRPATTFDWTALSPIPEPRLPSATPDLRLATSLQDLRRRRSGPFPPDEADEADEEVSPLTTRPVFSPVDRSRALSTSPESASYRLSPSGPSGLGIVSAPPRYPATASGGSDPRIVYSDTQGPMYRGRDGTLYAETKMTGTPDPKAIYFPTRTEKPCAAGTIIASTPLKQSHYNCFQKHMTMNRQSNRNCPLTCQTCGKADVEDRWVCTFCHLRVCDNCQRALNGHQRVLRSLVDQLGMSTPPLSLSSTSALDIESSA